jgi:ribonuclease J
MLEAVRPRFLVPVHGEIRHLHLHARLAQESGLRAENIFILHNGVVWASDGRKAWLEEAVPAGDIYVDGSLVGEIGEIVMRDRERLSQDGFVIVSVPINKQRKLAGEPHILSRGFLHMDASGELLAAARAEVKKDLQRNGHGKRDDHSQTVRKTLQNFFYKKTQSRPVILSNIIKV